MQLTWELRTGSRGRRTNSTDMHFGQLEVLECLWPRGASEPEYTEVRAGSRVGGGVLAHGGRPDSVLHFPHLPPQILGFPSKLGSQASARPSAHLRHTQTLRRVPKVTQPLLWTSGLGVLPRFHWSHSAPHLMLQLVYTPAGSLDSGFRVASECMGEGVPRPLLAFCPSFCPPRRDPGCVLPRGAPSLAAWATLLKQSMSC